MDASRRNLIAGFGGLAAAGAASTVLGKSLFRPAAPFVIRPQASVALRSTAVGRVDTTLPTIATDIKRVALDNVHTGEKLNVVFYENGKYVPDALADAMRVMRDWRNGQEHAMDPRLFDVLHGIREQLDTEQPFQLYSGYRSPTTNAAMHEHSHQVASNSQHMQGKASDIHVEGVQLDHLHRAALSLRAGGVGYYPVSRFVHVDVGPVRTWEGT
jgi:uncharacterized protein YcbK (DUF882 family)